MTSGTHNRRIHYFSQHWLAPLSLVQPLWPETLTAEDTVLFLAYCYLLLSINSHPRYSECTAKQWYLS